MPKVRRSGLKQSAAMSVLQVSICLQHMQRFFWHPCAPNSWAGTFPDQAHMPSLSCTGSKFKDTSIRGHVGSTPEDAQESTGLKAAQVQSPCSFRVLAVLEYYFTSNDSFSAQFVRGNSNRFKLRKVSCKRCFGRGPAQAVFLRDVLFFHEIHVESYGASTNYIADAWSVYMIQKHQ